MQHPSLSESRIREEFPAIDVAVLFTGVESALQGLRLAAKLASGLPMHISLLVKDERDEPRSAITEAMLGDFTSRYFLTLFPHAADLKIHVTRYPASTEDLWEVLPPRSIIFITGSGKRFWLSAEQKFARKLCRVGHEVILSTLAK